MNTPAPEPALHTDGMTWIPTGPGKSFRPLRFEGRGWSELMRLEPGSVVALHRHTGDVHAYNLSGTRQILDSGETIGLGDYVYEPSGNIDSWQAVGDTPCIVHIKVTGAVEYLDAGGHVTERADSASQLATYLGWCDQQGVEPAPQLVPELSQPLPRQTRENAARQATELATRYFTAWQARDEQALSEILAENVTFRGPLGTANGRTECIAGLMGMLGIVTAIEVQARVADDHDVITWFDLRTTAAAPEPTANRSHAEDGQITRIRVAFDPRGIVGATS
jgi:hypothetical protein